MVAEASAKAVAFAAAPAALELGASRHERSRWSNWNATLNLRR